jgi:hypothetical protein
VAQEVRRADTIRDAASAAARDENAKLKRLVAGLSLDKAMLQDVVSRKL